MKLNVIERSKRSVVTLVNNSGKRITLMQSDLGHCPGTIWGNVDGDSAELLSSTVYGSLLLITRYREDQEDELRWIANGTRTIELYIVKREMLKQKEFDRLTQDRDRHILHQSDLGTIVYRINPDVNTAELTWIRPTVFAPCASQLHCVATTA